MQSIFKQLTQYSIAYCYAYSIRHQEQVSIFYINKGKLGGFYGEKKNQFVHHVWSSNSKKVRKICAKDLTTCKTALKQKSSFVTANNRKQTQPSSNLLNSTKLGSHSQEKHL